MGALKSYPWTPRHESDLTLTCLDIDLWGVPLQPGSQAFEPRGLQDGLHGLPHDVWSNWDLSNLVAWSTPWALCHCSRHGAREKFFWYGRVHCRRGGGGTTVSRDCSCHEESETMLWWKVKEAGLLVNGSYCLGLNEQFMLSLCSWKFGIWTWNTFYKQTCQNKGRETMDTNLKNICVWHPTTFSLSHHPHAVASTVFFFFFVFLVLEQYGRH